MKNEDFISSVVQIRENIKESGVSPCFGVACKRCFFNAPLTCKFSKLVQESSGYQAIMIEHLTLLVEEVLNEPF